MSVDPRRAAHPPGVAYDPDVLYIHGKVNLDAATRARGRHPSWPVAVGPVWWESGQQRRDISGLALRVGNRMWWFSHVPRQAPALADR